MRAATAGRHNFRKAISAAELVISLGDGEVDELIGHARRKLNAASPSANLQVQLEVMACSLLAACT